MEDINIRFVYFVRNLSDIYVIVTHSVCSNITVIDGAIVNLFVIIPSQYENAKNVIISEVMNMKPQVLMLALEDT